MGQVRADAAKLPPWTPARRPRPYLRKAVHRHAVATGSIIMAWNTAHVFFRDWGGEVAPDYFSTSDKKLDRLENNDWVADAGDLYAIADYLRGVGMALGPVPRPRPLVRKPRIKSRRLRNVKNNR